MKPRATNWLALNLFRGTLKAYYEITALLMNRGFYCGALWGDSEYNVTINCDLTVSCNCQDYDGNGHLGDLREHSFMEVFFGPVAERFRQSLVAGKLPLSICARCGDLRRLPAGLGHGGAKLPTPHLPYRGFQLENTVRCNVDCVGCGRRGAARTRSEMQISLKHIDRIADLARELKLPFVNYFNLGEPFLSSAILEELRMFRSKNTDCRLVTSTNGILLDTDAKREAALLFNHIYFSIPGVTDAMVGKYMRHGSFEKAYANMKALMEYRKAKGLQQPVLEWKYLLFNWNDHPRMIKQAIELAREAKLDTISFWPTRNPFYGISWRYWLGGMDRVGVKCWKGRELDLRAQ